MVIRSTTSSTAYARSSARAESGSQKTRPFPAGYTGSVRVYGVHGLLRPWLSMWLSIALSARLWGRRSRVLSVESW